MQPQVWCGLGWTTELLDLRARVHRSTDLIPHLGVRDPLDPSGRGEKCLIRHDNESVKAYQYVIYCEGTPMERTARCLHDASQGSLRFTVYSNFPRVRFDACLMGD